MSFDHADLLLSNESPESSAKTLGGQLIERVHNAFSSSVILSEKERAQRGQHSDNLAEVVGDTVAMLPVKWGAAGAIRAGILYDTKSGFLEAAGGFGKNFAEGAVLNKLSAAAFGEGKLNLAIEKQLGKGLAAETTRFAATGFGIGVVKSGFRSETWFDQQGKLDFLKGGVETLKSGGIGAAVAIPGGFIGTRIAQAGFALNTKGLVSENTALRIAGLGSGYFSGAAVGGIQAVAAGADLKTTLALMNESGLVGAATGGLTIATLRQLQQLKDSHQTNAPDRSATVPKDKAYAAVETIEEGHSPQWLSSNEIVQIEQAKFDALKFVGGRDRGDQSLATKLRDLGDYTREEVSVHVAKRNAREVAANSADYDAFYNTGMEAQIVPSRTWNVRGVPVTMPESYAAKLDEVVRLRMYAAKEHSSNPAEHSLALKSKEQLKLNPLRDRAHAVDFLHLIEELPDRSLVKRVMIRDDSNPTDAWLSKTYKPDFKAAATASQDGVLSFYAQNRGYELGNYMRHEWGHLLMWAAKPEQHAFSKAADLEKDDYQSKKAYYISEYAKKDHDENWAEHMRGLLHPDPKVFLEVAHNAPVRSMVMGTALVKTLSLARAHEGSTVAGGLANRIAYLQQEIMPLAKNDLSYHLLVSKKDRGILSAQLLAKYAGDKELAHLSQTSKHETDPALAKAAFDAAFHNISQKRAVSIGYDSQMLPAGHNRSDQIKFLMDQLSPGNNNRDTAHRYLQRVSKERFDWYSDLFSLNNLDNNTRLNRVINLLDTAPDGPTQRLAWKHALESIGNNSDDRVNLALRALEKYDRLTEEATAILSTEAQPRTIGFLQDLQTHYNQRVAEMAKKGIAKINTDDIFAQSSKGLQSENMSVRMQSALTLAQTRDMRAANILIESLLRATDPQEHLAISRAMKTYITPGILKFHINQKIAGNPQAAVPLRKALQAPVTYKPKEVD
ncbi:MAG: HEAT repeat domain-containing protein [Candidatus Obscuribacterales bacterium]|nr:HEAT repeat domain-containing protein [Candidatus Obscuribacterales bacterium]